MKNNKKWHKSECKYKCRILNSKLAPLNHDVTCSKLLKYGENIRDKKLSVEHSRGRALAQEKNMRTKSTQISRIPELKKVLLKLNIAENSFQAWRTSFS